MIYSILILVVGFIVLIKSADTLIESSCVIAKRLKVSDWVIGITVVSFGSSLPELVVNVYAAVNGAGGVSLSNIFGSNAANILLALGLASLFAVIKAPQLVLRYDLLICILSMFLLGLFARYGVPATDVWTLSRIEGGVLLIAVTLYLFFAIRIHGNQLTQSVELPDDEVHKSLSKKYPWLVLLIALMGLVFGAKWVVDSALELARYFKLSESFIAFTIIALGTSLPEITVTIRAAQRGKLSLALANVVGSNIFNTLFVLGLSALVTPLVFETRVIADWMFATVCSISLAIFIITSQDRSLNRFHGALFILMYFVYIIGANK